jgi:hypothetical protein
VPDKEPPKIMWLKVVYFSLIIIFVFSTNSCGEKKLSFNCGISNVSQKGINHMQSLIDALEEYKTQNGRYPQYFNDLVPKYTKKIPMIGNERIVPGSPVYDHFIDENLGDSFSTISDDGSYFSIKFLPKDGRFCLMGKNNICEYTSDTKKWGCYQH